MVFRPLNRIGYCGLSRFADRCAPGETEIGYRFAKHFWGRGLATEAVSAVRDFAITKLHISRLIAIIDPGNIPARHVIEKTGFHYERDAMFEGYTHPDRVYVFDSGLGTDKLREQAAGAIGTPLVRQLSCARRAYNPPVTK